MDIDTDKLTQDEREQLVAKLAEPLTPTALKLSAVRTALKEADLESALGDDELRAIITALDTLAPKISHPYSGDGGPCEMCGQSQMAHVGVITASLTDFSLSAAADGGTAWTATLCVAGVPTVDSGMKRLLAVDGGSWLPLPLPLGLMDASPHADMVTAAPICGRIDSIAMAGNVCQASGIFSDGSDDPEVSATGSKAAALVGEGLVTGVSVDLVDCDIELRAYRGGEVVLDAPNDPISDGDNMPPVNESVVEVIEDDGEIDYIWCFDRWVVAGATICPVQALTQARISLVASAERGLMTRWFGETSWLPALTASAAGLAPVDPPAEWFDMPEAGQPTAITVTDDGQVFGHMALWDSCHTGFQGQCVPPPRSPSNYAGFHLGEIKTAEGERVAVGTLTMDTGHANRRLSAEKAVAHYDDTGTAAAYVRASDGQFGIWVAGTLSARLSAADAQALMASKPSGDWREIFRGRGRDLIGALQVNVPGFPVPRAITASGLLPDGGDAVQFVEALDCEPCADSFARELAVLAASADGVAGLAALAEAV